MTKASPKRWLWILLVVLLLPVLAIVILLQPPVLKALILPKVEEAVAMDLEVETLKLSPFSRIRLGGVDARMHDDSMELSLEEMELNYRLLSFLGETPEVQSLQLTGGELLLRPANFPEVESAPSPKEETTASEDLPAKLLGLKVGPVNLERVDIRIEEPGRTLNIQDLELEIASFAFSGTHDLTLKTNIDLKESAPLVPGELQAQVSGRISFAWPLQVEGQLELLQHRAAGSYDPLNNLSKAALALKLNEESLEHLELRLEDPQQRLLGRIQGSSPLNPLASTEDVSLQIDQIGPETFLLLGGLLGMDFGSASLEGSLRGNWVDDQLKLTANFIAQDLGLKQGTETLLKSNDFMFGLNAGFNAESKVLQLQQLNLGWTPENRFDNRLELKGALNIADPTALSGNLQIQAGRMDLDAILPASLLDPPPAENTANIEKEKEAAVVAEAAPLPLGRFALQGQIQQLRFQEFDLRDLLLQVQATSKQASIQPLSLIFNGSPLQLSAEVPLSGGLGGIKASLQAEKLHLPELAALSPQALPVDMEGKVSLQAQLSSDPAGDTFSVVSSVQASGLAISQEQSPLLKKNDYQLSLEAGYQLSSSQLQLPAFSLGWTPEESFQNEIRVQGELNLADPAALAGSLKVEGQQLNLDAILPPLPESEAAPEASTAPEEEAAAPEALPLGTFALNASFLRIQALGLSVDDLTLQAQSDAGSLRLNPLELRLNGSPISVKGRMPKDFSLPGTRAEINVTQLDLGKLVDAFAPEFKGRFEGKLDVGGTLAMAESVKLSTGALNAGISGGRLFLLEEIPEGSKAVKLSQALARLVLESSAVALNVPPEHFTAPPIEELKLDVILDAGVLNLKEAHFANQEMMLRSRGEVLIQEDPALSPIQDIQIQLGVSTNIAKRARIYRESRVENDRVFLPPFLQLQGTLGEPKLDVKKRVITGLAISGVTDNIEIGDEDTQNLLRGIGSLLTGEAPEPTPTPKPGEEPEEVEEKKPSTSERILEGINLFRRSREE